MGSIKTISIIVAANIKGLESGLGKANKSLAKFASGAARMGSMLSFGVTAPLMALGKSAFDTFAKFENGMMKVKTVTGASVSEFKMLTDEAKRLGATTQFTAIQVADLQLVLGRKGFDPTAIKNMEKSILDLALATGEDLSMAAEVTAASINAFQLESSDAASVANTLASAAANSSIQLSTFSTAFGHAGASANAVGVDLEELSAMMGVLMDNGIKASKAGTGLRTAFSKLNEEGVPFKETLDKLASGQMSLNDATKLVGRTGANQLLILAKNRTKVKELTHEYKTNTTRLDEMAEAMGNTTHAKVLKMQSAIEGMKIEMGALIADAITPIIKYITNLAQKFTQLDSSTKKTILIIAAIAAALGPMLLILAVATTAYGALGAAIGFLVSPIGLAIAALVLIPIALKYIIDNWDAFAERLGDWSWWKNAIIQVLQWLLKYNPFSVILKGAQGLYDFLGIEAKVYNPFDSMADSLEDLKEELPEYEHEFGNIMDSIKDGLKNLDIKLPNIFGNIATEADEAVEKIKFVKSELDFSSEYEKSLEIEVTPLVKFDNFMSGLEEELSEVSEGVAEFFDKWGDSINMVGDIFGKMMQNQMVDLENSHKKKADAIANSNMNEEDKATAMLNLDKETAKEKAKILRKQAIAEKAAAVVSAVMNGALAISKTLGQAGFLGIPLSAIVGALAATQVATIAASPIPAFAKGGLVTGATMGLVGEGRGTTMSNPEVIAPLDKLKSMLGDSGGGGTVIPDVRITGDDLLIVFDRANRRKERR